MISYEFLCGFYGVSMRFLYRFPAAFARKKAVFPRYFKPLRDEKKIRAQRTSVRPAGSDPLAVQSQRGIPGSVLGRPWVGPGSVLDRFWVHPGLALVRFWLGKHRENRRIREVFHHKRALSAAAGVHKEDMKTLQYSHPPTGYLYFARSLCGTVALGFGLNEAFVTAQGLTALPLITIDVSASVGGQAIRARS